MVERVREVLQRSFPSIELDLEVMTSGRITGNAVWSGFADFDQVDRQTMLRDALRKELGADATQVSVLLTYTPRELYAMKAA